MGHDTEKLERDLKSHIILRVMPALAERILQSQSSHRKRRLQKELIFDETQLKALFDEAIGLLFRAMFIVYAGDHESKMVAWASRPCSDAKKCTGGTPMPPALQNPPTVLAGDPPVPDLLLTFAINHLLHPSGRGAALPLADSIDPQLKVRLLGSIHESLLEYRLRVEMVELLEPNRAHQYRFFFARDKAGRKSTGSYYTPVRIVKYIVENTVGPMLQRHLTLLHPQFHEFESINVRRIDADETVREAHQNLVDLLFGFRICDPAMGAGYFLVEAMNFVSREMTTWLESFAIFIQEWTEAPQKNHRPRVARDPEKLLHRVKQHVLQRCIFGVDLNPLATELARFSLRLEADAPLESSGDFEAHVRVGDSLKETLKQARFDCVIGNPPYLGHKGDIDAGFLRRRFRVCRHHANLATAFIELACDITKAGGAVGLIVPKSIQYVDGWEAARQLIATEHRLEQLIDVSEAFNGVLLEQTIFICSRHDPVETYSGGEFHTDGSVDHPELPMTLFKSLRCLPARIEPQSLDILKHLTRIGTPLGSFSRTSQALGYQAKINRVATGKTLPILRGKHVRPLRLEPTVDWIDESFLHSRKEAVFTPKVKRLLQSKIVSQNIVAHITQPRPRLWIISAPDPWGTLCLNTISTTIISDRRYGDGYVSILLNSSVASWFYREFVFCRAVRTMHFDQYYAGKLPIPLPTPQAMADLPRIMREADIGKSRSHRQRHIDEFAFTAYELNAVDRNFIIDYCYGPQGYDALTTKM